MAMSIKSLKFLLEHSIDENGDTIVKPLNLPVISISSIRNKLSGMGELKLNNSDPNNNDNLQPQNVNISFKKMEKQSVFVTKCQYREIKNNLRDEIVFTRDYIHRPFNYDDNNSINGFVYKIKLIFSAKRDGIYTAQMGGMYTSYIDGIIQFGDISSRATCNRKIFTDKSSECFLLDNVKGKNLNTHEVKEHNTTVTGKGHVGEIKRFTLSYLLDNTNQNTDFILVNVTMGRRNNHSTYFYGWDSNYKYKNNSDFIFGTLNYGLNQDIIFRNNYGQLSKAQIMEYKNVMRDSRNDVYHMSFDVT